MKVQCDTTVVYTLQMDERELESNLVALNHYMAHSKEIEHIKGVPATRKAVQEIIDSIHSVKRG